MQLGITVFLTDNGVDPVTAARAVEERGFASLYLPEHTHLPVAGPPPPAAVGGVRAEDYPRSLDPYVALAAAASVTRRIRLGTGVTLLAQHHPLSLAKQIATLDLLCGGRFVLGFGYGWNRAEAADHGVAFADRRRVAHEHLACMRALWEHEVAEYHGRFVDLPPSRAWPKPVQSRIPTLIGGAAGPVLFEAVAEHADGWMPVGGAGVGDALKELRRAFERRGRDPASARVVPFGTIPDPGKLEHYRALGVDEVVLRVPGGDASDVLSCLDAYARLVTAG